MPKYTPTEWVDTLKDAQGNIVQKGTPITAGKLNKLEAALAAAPTIEDTKALSTQLSNMVIDVKTYGAVGDYNPDNQTGTDNYNSFSAAIAEANKTHSELLIPVGNYYISKEIVMPRNVNCMGNIRGAKLIFRQTRDINVKNLSCDDILFSGVWRGNINIRGAKKVVIDGSIDWMGSIWNQFSIKVVEELEINISEGCVNQNQYTGGRIGKLRITGSDAKYPTICEAHNNWFTNVDISSGGAIQDDSKMQSNYLINCYSEASHGTSLITGNWQILGNTGDKTPGVRLNSHIMFSNEAIPRSSQDYISMSTTNLVEGGEWDSLDTLGRPKGITYVNANATVDEDATAPDGSGRVIKVISSLAYAGVSLNFNPIQTGKGGITLFLKGDISTIQLVTPDGSTLANMFTSVDIGNGWKLYRIIISSPSVTKAIIYLNTGEAVTKTIYISGVKATPYKATPLPYFNPSIYLRGTLPSAPTGGKWRKGEFVTNDNVAANPEVAGWLCTNSSPLTFRKMLLDNSFMTKKIWQKSVTDTNKTVVRVKSSDYTNSAIIELKVRFHNSQASSPDFAGYVGTAKYLIALSKEGASRKESVVVLGAAIVDFQNAATKPVLSVVVNNNNWDINIDIPSNQGATTCYCEMEYTLPTVGTTLTFLES